MKKELLNIPNIQNGPNTLIIGIGNAGREDDGLGWAFLDALDKFGYFKGQLEYRYQLQVEDAERIQGASQVIFVDATKEKTPNGYAWQPCLAVGAYEFTSHAVPPQGVLYLCQLLYGNTPSAWILKIEGLHWNLKVGMSTKAKNNLERALRNFEKSCEAPVPDYAGSDMYPE